MSTLCFLNSNFLLNISQKPTDQKKKEIFDAKKPKS